MAVQKCVAYFDDSGHPDSQDAVLVAGWVAQVEQWSLLEKEWNEDLKEFKLETFHMKDFLNRKCTDYEHLSNTDKKRLLGRLVGHIRTRTRHSFCSIVPMADYKEVNANYYFEEILGKPYAFAAVGVIQRLRAWKDKYASDYPLEIILEDGTKHKGDLMKVFKQFHFNDPIFRDRKHLPPLQAADMLAFEGRKAVENKALNDNSEPIRRLLENLTVRKQITVGRTTRKDLVRFHRDWMRVRAYRNAMESVEDDEPS